MGIAFRRFTISLVEFGLYSGSNSMQMLKNLYVTYNSTLIRVILATIMTDPPNSDILYY